MLSYHGVITIPPHGLLQTEQFCPAGGWGPGWVPGWVQDFGQDWVQDLAPELQLWAEGPPCLLATDCLVQSRLYHSTWSPGVELAIDGQLPCLLEPSCDNRLLCIKQRVVTGKINSYWHVGAAIRRYWRLPMNWNVVRFIWTHIYSCVRDEDDTF